MKHSICNIEFSATDLDRAASFYHGMFNWSLTPVSDNLHFRSPDGLEGIISRAESVAPGRLPLLRIEVEEFAPLFEMAGRLDGGYVGFADPVHGDWTVNLRDPDGNLIRLARISQELRREAAKSEGGETLLASQSSKSQGDDFGSASRRRPGGGATSAKPAAGINGHATGDPNGLRRNGNVSAHENPPEP